MLNHRIEILALAQKAGGYEWVRAGQVWGAVEMSDRKNLFSAVGIGARGAEIIIRSRVLTLHNAARWNGRHCFLTGIVPQDNRLYLELTAALVTVRTCTVTRQTTILDALNRPVAGPAETVSFPGVLTEKYMGKETLRPQDAITVRYVLVTPKPVVLAPGEPVTIGGSCYAVEVCHTLDEYKNEYEIARKADA